MPPTTSPSWMIGSPPPTVTSRGRWVSWATLASLTISFQTFVPTPKDTADQALSNQQEVKVYGAQHVEMQRYSDLANEYLRLNLKVEATRSISLAKALASWLILSGGTRFKISLSFASGMPRNAAKVG